MPRRGGFRSGKSGSRFATGGAPGGSASAMRFSQRRKRGPLGPGRPDQPRTIVRRIVGKLVPVEALVEAPLCQELAMRALLDDLALVDDEDSVGIEDGGKPVSDDQDRAALHQPVEGE